MNRKEYLRTYQREWIKKRREDFFANKCCVQCGSAKRLELDHVIPEEKVSNRIWSWSKSKREVEIKKCQILCYECHKEKTRIWQMSRRTHGRTWYGYGCRCEICFEAQQKHNAQRNNKMLA